MKLLTKAQEDKLIKNHELNVKHREENEGAVIDLKPVVKFFNPVGAGTYLITEYDPEYKEFFGIVDLQNGCPELGPVSRTELESYRGFGGLGIERDTSWTAKKTLQEYADEAYKERKLLA